jgi:hypothetical protein
MPAALENTTEGPSPSSGVRGDSGVQHEPARVVVEPEETFMPLTVPYVAPLRNSAGAAPAHTPTRSRKRTADRTSLSTSSEPPLVPPARITKPVPTSTARKRGPSVTYRTAPTSASAPGPLKVLLVATPSTQSEAHGAPVPARVVTAPEVVLILRMRRLPASATYAHTAGSSVATPAGKENRAADPVASTRPPTPPQAPASNEVLPDLSTRNTQLLPVSTTKSAGALAGAAEAEPAKHATPRGAFMRAMPLAPNAAPA